MTLALYYSPGAASLSSHIVLEESGATYEARVIKLAENEQRKPEYLAINPHGRVPSLMLEDGKVLTEGAAIMTYLALSFPKAKLLPADPLARAQCIEWLSWLASSMHVAFQQTRRPMRFVGNNENAFPLVKAAGTAHLRAFFADIERRLSASAYAVGDAFTIADAHLFVFCMWGRGVQLVNAQATPSFLKWGQKVAARPSVIRVAEAEGIKLDLLK